MFSARNRLQRDVNGRLLAPRSIRRSHWHQKMKLTSNDSKLTVAETIGIRSAILMPQHDVQTPAEYAARYVLYAHRAVKMAELTIFVYKIND